MYILNVTLHIEDRIHQEGMKWVKTRFIPQMMNTNKFAEVLLTRVMVREETGGSTYAIQFKATSKALLKAYYREDDAAIFREFKKFGEQIVFFRTEMEVLDPQ